MATILSEASYVAVQSAISAISDEQYTTAKRLTNSGIITASNEGINPDTETYSGQLRWRKPLNHVVNVGSAKDSTKGSFSTSEAAVADYIKTVRTSGVERVNIANVLTQSDGLLKYGKDFAHGRAEDENASLVAVLKGVMLSEVLIGAGASGLGGQTFDNDPAAANYGMYVDLGNEKAVVDATAAKQGSARAEGFMNALAMAYKDLEPSYAYLVVTPRVLASLRSANMIESDRVSEANIEFETILGGKFRLISSRTNMGFTSGELAKLNALAGIDIVGTNASFIVMPGAISFNNLSIETPVEIQRVAGSYKGTGTTEMWNRWGYIVHPFGYSWAGPTNDFAATDLYRSMLRSSTPITLSAAADAANSVGIWTRKTSDVLSLGIVPVFHA